MERGSNTTSIKMLSLHFVPSFEGIHPREECAPDNSLKCPKPRLSREIHKVFGNFWLFILASSLYNARKFCKYAYDFFSIDILINASI